MAVPRHPSPFLLPALAPRGAFQPWVGARSSPFVLPGAVGGGPAASPGPTWCLPAEGRGTHLAIWCFQA